MISLRTRTCALLRCIAVATLAGLPLATSVEPAGAQQPPSSVGIGDDVVLKAQQSIGVVTIRKSASTGWIAGSGLVVTADTNADTVGTSASFARPGSKEVSACYVAMHLPDKHLSLLRCTGLSGAPLGVDPSYPAPGTPVFVASARANQGIIAVSTEGATVVANDVSFMGDNRLRLSLWVGGNDGPQLPGLLDTRDFAGAPIINGQGKVVSTLLAAPSKGGQPIGIRPTELTSAIGKALPLPTSFSSAAILTVGRRAVIPAAVGLVAGLIWGFRLRNGTMLTKVLGCVALGLVGAVAYTFFTVLVVGPQTLIG